MNKTTPLPFEKKSVGTSPWRVDGIGLVTGTAKFTDDMFFKNLLHAKIMGSPHAHARILDIDTTEAEKLPGVVIVLTYKNVPRVAHTTAGQGFPEPSPYDAFMFDMKVRFVGDRVACVAAETPEIAEQAIKLIKVKYEPLKAVFDVREAVKDGAPIIHDEPDADGIHDRNHNIAAHYDVEIGKLDQRVEGSGFRGLKMSLKRNTRNIVRWNRTYALVISTRTIASCCARRRRCRGTHVASWRNACKSRSTKSESSNRASAVGSVPSRKSFSKICAH